MNANAQLHLLGNFRLTLPGGAEFQIHGKKKQGLLAYLALSPDCTASRDKAISVFWSDRDGEKQARPSLRTALSELRKQLRGVGLDNMLVSDRSSISLQTDSVAIDTLKLRLLSKSQVLGEKRLALDLYRGDLLDGFDLGDRAFEEWVYIERIQYREVFREILADLMANCIESSSFDEGVKVAGRMLMLDNTDEAAHRALMRVYEAKGNHSRALKQYQDCCDLLQKELQGNPSEETRLLYEQIKSSSRASKPRIDTYEATISEKVLIGKDDLSIGVVPFIGQSNGEEDEFLADGFSEDIIGALSRFRWMSVAPRSATFSFRTKVSDAVSIGKTLGLKYVVDGSIRRSDEQVRVSIELIEVDTAKVLWSERYDGKLSNSLNIQSEITAKIVSQIDARLRMNEVKQVLTWNTSNPRAYDCLLQAISNMHEMTRDSFSVARNLFEQAEQLDPNFAAIYSWWALREIFYIGQGWDQDLSEGKTPKELAEKAIRRDPEDAIALAICGHAKSFLEGDFDEARRLFERSLLENPNSAFTWMLSSATYSYIGDSAEALRRLDYSTRLCPVEPLYEFMYDSARCLAHSFAKEYKEAAMWGRRLVRESPNFSNGYKQLLVALGHLGENLEAKEYTRRLLELEPEFTIEDFRELRPFKHEKDREEFIKGLIKAGVPSRKANKSGG